jgi:hypothetical protein
LLWEFINEAIEETQAVNSISRRKDILKYIIEKKGVKRFIENG